MPKAPFCSRLATTCRVRSLVNFGAAALLAQRLNLFFKIQERLEPPVHGGEAQVSNLVELPERPQEGQAPLLGGDLGAATGPDRLFDLLGQDRQIVLIDRTSLAGAAPAAPDLCPEKPPRAPRPPWRHLKA